jgi:hypothetical protein
MGRAPLPNLFFRPEEEHIVSGEDNIIPPFCRRDKAVKEPVRRLWPLQTDLEMKRLSRLRAMGVNRPRLMECRQDAERVPSAIGKVLNSIRLNDVVRRNS